MNRKITALLIFLLFLPAMHQQPVQAIMMNIEPWDMARSLSRSLACWWAANWVRQASATTGQIAMLKATQDKELPERFALTLGTPLFPEEDPRKNIMLKKGNVTLRGILPSGYVTYRRPKQQWRRILALLSRPASSIAAAYLILALIGTQREYRKKNAHILSALGTGIKLAFTGIKTGIHQETLSPLGNDFTDAIKLAIWSEIINAIIPSSEQSRSAQLWKEMKVPDGIIKTAVKINRVISWIRFLSPHINTLMKKEGMQVQKHSDFQEDPSKN